MSELTTTTDTFLVSYEVTSDDKHRAEMEWSLLKAIRSLHEIAARDADGTIHAIRVTAAAPAPREGT